MMEAGVDAAEAKYDTTLKYRSETKHALNKIQAEIAELRKNGNTLVRITLADPVYSRC